MVITLTENCKQTSLVNLNQIDKQTIQGGEGGTKVFGHIGGS